MPQDSIDYGVLLQRYPWIVEKNLDCILSPDSDGLLCGLLVSHYLDWKVRGFYDGKVLVVQRGIRARECVFLDMEIFRKGVKSVGQHMLMYNKAQLPGNWENFQDAISANNLRSFDFKNDFKAKYPFGTIHLLLSIFAQKYTLDIGRSAISPLLYADGTFKNQFNYPENCISWLEFLGASDKGNPLQKIFLDRHYSVYELMVALSEFFGEIAVVGGGKRGGDKIKISDSRGNLVNINVARGAMRSETVNQAKTFLNILSGKTGWTFNERLWHWGPYDVIRFKKGSVKPGKARYNALLAQNPVSLAIISRNSIEYTLDPSRQF